MSSKFFNLCILLIVKMLNTSIILFCSLKGAFSICSEHTAAWRHNTTFFPNLYLILSNALNGLHALILVSR